MFRIPAGSRASVKLIRDGTPLDIVVTLLTLDNAVAGAPRGAAPATPASDLNSLGLVVGAVDAGPRSKLGLGASYETGDADTLRAFARWNFGR